MKLPTYLFVVQMGAALAVVVSLGLVAYELKLSRDMAIGELALSVYLAEANQYHAVLDSESYNRAAYKLEVSGEGQSRWFVDRDIQPTLERRNGRQGLLRFPLTPDT